MKESKKRYSEVVAINVIDHESAQIEVDFNIQEIENTSVGICWSYYGKPNMKDSDYQELFLKDDNLVSFIVEGLAGGREYTCRAYINAVEDGASQYDYSAPFSFTTDDLPELPCEYTENTLIVDGDLETGSVTFGTDDPKSIDYFVQAESESYKIIFGFDKHPMTGIYRTVKNGGNLGKRDVRIELESKFSGKEYLNLTGEEIYLETDSYEEGYDSEFSISFCEIQFLRSDLEGLDTVTIKGELNNK